MCGLIGYASSSMVNKEKDTFSILFMLNALRGAHGCGLISNYTQWESKKNRNGNYYDHICSEYPSSAFIYEQDYDTFVGGTKVIKALMGHSRHATKGKISIENNHPFLTNDGNILGMHNGTIQGSFKGSSKYETDSEALFNLIEQEGLKGALDRVYKESNSFAFAIQYYDNLDDSIKIIRNTQRPLHLAVHKRNKNTMFWASEAMMLAYALSKCGYANDYEIKSLDVGDLVTIKPYTNDISITEKYYTTPVKVYSNYNNSASCYEYGRIYRTDEYDKSGRYVGNSRNDNYEKKEKSNVNCTSLVSTQNKTKVVNKEYSVEKNRKIELGNFVITQWQYEDVLQKGCAMCGNPSVLINNKLSVKFFEGTKSEFICDQCLESFDEQQLKLDYGIKGLVTPEWMVEHPFIDDKNKSNNVYKSIVERQVG